MTPPDEPKPLKAILGRPMQRPGETKEEAARRLARELFGKLKPPADQSGLNLDLQPEAPPESLENADDRSP